MCNILILWNYTYIIQYNKQTVKKSSLIGICLLYESHIAFFLIITILVLLLGDLSPHVFMALYVLHTYAYCKTITDCIHSNECLKKKK